MQPLPRCELCHHIQVGSPRRPIGGLRMGLFTGRGRGFCASLAGGVFPRESEPGKRHCGSARSWFLRKPPPLRSGRVCTPRAVLPPSPRPLANFTISPSLPQSRSLGRETPPPNKEVRCCRSGNGGNGADGEDLRLLQSAVGEALALARSHPRR